MRYDMNQFTYEEIKEWVIDEIYHWFGDQLGNQAENWSCKQIIEYFVNHYDEDFEMIGE